MNGGVQMKFTISGVAVLIIVGCASTPPTTTEATTCFKSGEREAILAMDIIGFDNTQGQGWRLVADRECYSEAAQLIEDYRARSGGPDFARHHQAQMHAAAEERDKAVALLDQLITDAEASEQWTDLYYHRATRAFLVNDLESLQAARANLAAVPAPPGFTEALERFKKQYPDFSPPEWPLNLDVVDAFIACFGKSYNEAYGGDTCREAGDVSAYRN